MREIEHPSEFIARELTERIQQSAGEAELLGRLHSDQLHVIRSQGWFNMFAPKENGGLELPLPEGIRLEEALSWADGSTGWVVTLCSGAAWFAGFIDSEIVRKVFKDNQVCFAGSGAPGGTAQWMKDGYEVSGYWKYASGSDYATVFTANCQILKDGIPLHHDDGSPAVLSFLFLKEEVILHRKWNSMGMVATGSHDFEVKKIHLAPNRSFRIDSTNPNLKRPLYQYPFQQLAETTLAANLCGMAIRFMDLCQILFSKRIKDRSYTESQGSIRKQELAGAKENIRVARQSFYNAVDSSWSIGNESKAVPPEKLNEVSACSNQLARISRMWVDELYPYCGLTAANKDEEINRVWRNLHTATQHSIFNQ